MKTLFTILSAAWIAALCALSLMPPPAVATRLFPGSDKVAHLGMYAVLAALLLAREHFARKRSRKQLITTAVLVSALVGGALEIAQGTLVAGRVASWGDALANTAGAVAAAGAYALKIRGKQPPQKNDAES